MFPLISNNTKWRGYSRKKNKFVCGQLVNKPSLVKIGRNAEVQNWRWKEAASCHAASCRSNQLLFVGSDCSHLSCLSYALFRFVRLKSKKIANANPSEQDAETATSTVTGAVLAQCRSHQSTTLDSVVLHTEHIREAGFCLKALPSARLLFFTYGRT